MRSKAHALTVPYGPTGREAIADRVGDLWLPDGPGPHPVATVIHGGFWRARYDRHLMDDISADLARRGWAAWNIEYRRVGAGGGWPTTFEDVALALDLLAGLAPEHDLDLDRLVTIGHSAGGHLAVWAAFRHRIDRGCPGADPRVRPVLAVGQAAVVDLQRAAADALGAGAVIDLMGGGPDEVPDRYAVASPSELLPVGVPTVLVHAPGDDLVPLSQSEGFAEAAVTQGDDADLVVVPGAHFEHIDPTTEAWTAVARRIEMVR